MKIVLVIDSANVPGGGAEVCFSLANAFIRHSHDTEVVSMRGVDWRPDREHRAGQVKVTFLNATNRVQEIWKLHRYLKSNSYDVCHAIGTGASAASLYAQRFALRPRKAIIVGSEHYWFSPHYGDFTHLRGRVLGSLYRFAYRRLDGVVCVSEGLRNRLSELPGMRMPIIAIPNPVRQFGESSDSRSVSSTGHVEYPIRVLSVGELAERKDFATLLRACEIVNRQVSCRVTIVGEGGLRSELEKQAKQAGLELLLAGYQSDPGPYYQDADVFANSSTSEAFGLVIVEAMSAGLQVVATDCPSGPSEILRGGELGHLVPVGDHVAMAEAILKSVKMPTEPNALKAAAAQYSPDNVASEYLRFFSQLMGSTLSHSASSINGK